MCYLPLVAIVAISFFGKTYTKMTKTATPPVQPSFSFDTGHAVRRNDSLLKDNDGDDNVDDCQETPGLKITPQ